jgi:two-component system, NarL family, nitrate/nitrite response regulator NarL
MIKKIKLTIADDHSLFINGLELLLQDEKDIEILDIVKDSKTLITSIEKKLPDMVLLDINMPGMNGLDAAKTLRGKYPGLKIIMLSTYNEAHLKDKAKKNGANGYLLKTDSKEDLLQAISLVSKGQDCFLNHKPDPVNEFQKGDIFLKQFDLTKRELEILQLLKSNQKNQQIADQLFLSIFTVETHRKNIMKKLGLNNPASLMKFIIENKI